jgi:hypothetical protein
MRNRLEERLVLQFTWGYPTATSAVRAMTLAATRLGQWSCT